MWLVAQEKVSASWGGSSWITLNSNWVSERHEGVYILLAKLRILAVGLVVIALSAPI
jgi:hypothetical protein